MFSRAVGVPVVIEVVTDIAAAPAVVFDLELDVDVHADSLPGSRETASTGSGRRLPELGDEVTFRARHVGLPWRTSSRITAHERPHRFVVEQTRGPRRARHRVHRRAGLSGRSAPAPQAPGAVRPRWGPLRVRSPLSRSRIAAP